MGIHDTRGVAAGNVIGRVVGCTVLLALCLGPGEVRAESAEEETGAVLRTTVASILAGLSWEPGCVEVIDRALLTLAPSLTGMATPKRIRASALLPRLRISIYKNLEHDESLDSGSDGDVKIGIDTDNDLEIRGYLEWDLSKLVFNPAESAAEGKRLADLKWRSDVAAQVASIYHERKKLRVLLLVGMVEDPIDLMSIALRVEELTALLDSYTNGWYTTELLMRSAKAASAPTFP